MKKILSCAKTAVILLIVTALTLGIYTYMLLRPISYGMKYRNETTYDGGVFEGTMTFNADMTMLNKNTNLDQELKSHYYYKDGYIFYTYAATDEEYEAEVAIIDENFDEAITTPFYADEINAFRLVAAEADGYSAVYFCNSAVVFAIAFGVIELILIAITCSSFVLYKKSKN